MPDRHSMPDSPPRTHQSTTVSQFSPAATRTATRSPSGAAAMPRGATRTTVPGKPASATTRLLPPPRTNTGSPRWSASLTVSMTCWSVPASMKRAAGPPRPSVVYPASVTCSRTVTSCAPFRPATAGAPSPRQRRLPRLAGVPVTGPASYVITRGSAAVEALDLADADLPSGGAGQQVPVVQRLHAALMLSAGHRRRKGHGRTLAPVARGAASPGARAQIWRDMDAAGWIVTVALAAG